MRFYLCVGTPHCCSRTIKDSSIIHAIALVTCSLIMKNACTAVAYLETAPRLSNGNRSLISVK